MKDTDTDPLHDPAFKAPGLAEKLREAFFGLSRPLQCVQIELTSHCFGACIYCPHTTQAAAWKARHMSAATFAATWPLLKRTQRAHLQGWGEPLLHPRFFDFAAFASKAGCQVSTTSCGHGISAAMAERIVMSGMDLIAFSLAGTDAKSNSARANVDFDLACQGIKTLRAAIKKVGRQQPLEIHLAYIMLADRMEAAAELPRLMNELDVEMAVVSTLDYLSIPTQEDLAFAPEDHAKIDKARLILEKAARLAAADGRALHFTLPAPQSAATEDGCRENITRCLYVNAEGQLSPCVYLNVPGSDPPEKRRIFGNCLRDDPWEIWLGEEFAAFRKELAGNRPADVCLRCPKRFEI